MDYTPEQIKILEFFEKGRCWTDLPEENMMAFHYVNEKGLLQPRADIEDDLYQLSEEGKLHAFPMPSNGCDCMPGGEVCNRCRAAITLYLHEHPLVREDVPIRL